MISKQRADMHTSCGWVWSSYILPSAVARSGVRSVSCAYFYRARSAGCSFLQMQLCIHKQIHMVLQVFPNGLVLLEQIHMSKQVF